MPGPSLSPTRSRPSAALHHLQAPAAWLEGRATAAASQAPRTSSAAGHDPRTFHTRLQIGRCAVAGRAGLAGALLGLALLVAAAATAATAPSDSLAQRLRACTACHASTDRVQADAFVPRLAGKPAGYLREQLLNFRTGRRHYAPMQGLLAGLPEPYLDEIARYFAEAPHTAATPEASDAPAVLARGEAVVRQGVAGRQVPACQACHGEALAGTAPAVPGLLGLPRNYLLAQLGAWRTGQRQARPPDCMAEVVRRLSDDDLSAAAAYLASRPLPARWAPATQAPAHWPLDCGSVAAQAGRP